MLLRSSSPPLLPQKRQTKHILLLAIVILSLSSYYYYFYHLTPQSLSIADRPSGLDYSYVRWSRYAYVQYATNPTYLCNSLMIFDSLHQLGSKADRVLLYPDSWTMSTKTDETTKLLELARDKYSVKLSPIEIKHSGNEPTWVESINKLQAFGLTQYDKVIHLDSDMTVLKHMDDMFFLPAASAAMPRAYWLNSTLFLNSQVIILEPSKATERDLLDISFEKNLFDMDALNEYYAATAMVLPHRYYFALTGDFRGSDHSLYLGNTHEAWDPEAVYNRVRIIHFSDWPFPKPWLTSHDQVEGEVPACEGDDGAVSCRNRKVWTKLYHDFRDRRKAVCEDPFNTPGGPYLPKETPAIFGR